MTTRRLTFVSVVFEAEFLLLQLQARSMATFLPQELVEEILVIDNSARGMPTATKANLLRGYEHLSHVVRVLRPQQICQMPGAIGWRSQQVLKLCVASEISTERYVALDAKNHFVDRVGPELFEAPDGRPRTKVHSYEHHPFLPMLEHVLRYLDLDPAEHVGRFIATVTPFVFDSGIVRSMVQGMECRSRKSFAQEFVANELIEFFLYAGWIIASGRSLEDVYQLDQASWPTIWPGSADRDGVEEAIYLVGERHAAVLSVHRKALSHLDTESSRTLATYWAGRQLFSSVDEAEQFIIDSVRAFERAKFRKRVRELPHRARAVPRRLRRTLRIGAVQT
jgi:hypothetical protein